jgi:hypothetical protein
LSISLWKGNTSPSIQDTIRVNKAAFDLTGCTVKFRMRADTSTDVLKVDDDAVIIQSSPTMNTGQVRYDWDTLDTDTAGDFLGWWHVVLPGGGVQDTDEFEVRIEEHADTSTDYATLTELRNSFAAGSSPSFEEEEMVAALHAASRDVDGICRRRFWLDPTVVDRYYTAFDDVVQIDDLSSSDSVVVTLAGTELVAGTDYLLEPLNAEADGRPFEQIRLLVDVDSTPAGLKVTGKFGWLAVPQKVNAATKILAGRILLRRQAPLGFQLTDVNAIRVAGDIDVDRMLSDMIRVRSMKTLPLQ